MSESSRLAVELCRQYARESNGLPERYDHDGVTVVVYRSIGDDLVKSPDDLDRFRWFYTEVDRYKEDLMMEIQSLNTRVSKLESLLAVRRVVG